MHEKRELAGLMTSLQDVVSSGLEEQTKRMEVRLNTCLEYGELIPHLPA